MAQNRRLTPMNSVMMSRKGFSGRKDKDRKVFIEDLKGLTFEFANFILLKKGISPDKLKERLPALYDSVVVRHPLYNDILEQYIAHNQQPQHQKVLEKNLASSQSEKTQAGIMDLAQALIDAEDQYRASVNMVQQVASDVLSKNIRAVRRAGAVIRRHVTNKTLQAALKQHNQYLTTLSGTETLVQSCIDRITEAKDGRESYSESCNILMDALKKSMKQNRDVKPMEGIEQTKARASFIERLQRKFSTQAITEALVVSFLPDIYEAIDLDISDTQMQAAVDLAEHYIRLKNEYELAEAAFRELPPIVVQTLAKAGVKFQSPYDYAMAVACDPMQIMAHYFSDQWRDYLQSRPLTKQAVSALINVAYGVMGVATHSLGSVTGYAFGRKGVYFSTLASGVLTSKPRLTESAYINAMAFHGFLRNLGVVSKGDKTDDDALIENNNKQALFNHYFKGREASGRKALTFEAYLANEAAFDAISACYEADGQLLPAAGSPKNDDFLAVIARVGYLQNALTVGVLSPLEIQGMIDELNKYYTRFSSYPLFKQYLAPTLYLMMPFIYERLLVPVIYRLVDKGIVGKTHPDYAYLGEILKALQKKTLISQGNVSDVLALFEQDERSEIQSIIMQMLPWQQNGAAAIHVVKPEPKSMNIVTSINTVNKALQRNIENTLNLIQPRLILESVIQHLDDHMTRCGQPGLPLALREINGAKLAYCAAVKAMLERILQGEAFADNKTLAGCLLSMNLTVPALPSPSKGEVVKLLMRVADEFGPVTSGSEDATPLVKRVMNFVVSQVDHEALSGVYEALNSIKDNRSQLARGDDTDNLTAVWFEDESIDPFDMDAQGGRIVRVVVKRYMKALTNPIYDGRSIEAVIAYFKLIPGYEFVADKLSGYVGERLTPDHVAELVCQFLGMQAHTHLHEQSYVVRLSHAFFKVTAMPGDDLAEKIALTGLVSEPSAKKDIEALQQWVEAEALIFKPSEAPQGIAEKIFAIEGDDPLHELKLQLLLTHCDYLKTYAMGLESRERRSAILLSVIEALMVCQTPAARAEQLTDDQVSMVFRLLNACKEMSEVAIAQAAETVKAKVDTLSGEVKATNDKMIRTINRKRTVLNIIFQVGYYIADLGALPYAIFSVVKALLPVVATIKALTTITVKAVLSALGTAMLASPIGFAILGARFVFGLAWHAFQYRKAFRQDWKASESILGKVGVIAKYTLKVLGKALLSTLLSAALVGAIVGAVKKVIGFIPLIGLIKEKLGVKARLREFESVMNAFRVLKNTVNDASFDSQVSALKDKLASLKHETVKVEAWKRELDGLVSQRRDVMRLAAMLPSTDRQVVRALQANPPKVQPFAKSQTVWNEFVEARARADIGGREVIRYFYEPPHAELVDAESRPKKRRELMHASMFHQPPVSAPTETPVVARGLIS